MIVSFGQQEVHLRDYLYILRKRRFLMAIFFILVLVIGILFTMNEKVLYQASAKILIESENPNVVNFSEVMALDASDTDYYQTQYLMIQSKTLINRLLREENLYEDPHFQSMQKGRFRRLLRSIPFLPEWLQKFIVPTSPEDLFIKYMLRISPVRNSRLVAVNIRHSDAAKAADIANALVDLYIKQSLEARFLVSNQATELLNEQLEGLKERVTTSEGKLQAYKEKHDLVSIPSIREQNEFLQDAKLELVKIQAEEGRLSKRYLPAHPKMIHVISSMEALEEKIAEEEARIMALSSVAIGYAQLEREMESGRQIYEALLARLEETTSEAKTQASNIMVVDRAITPPRPFKPRPFLNIFVACVIGFLGSIFLAFFIEYFDSTIKVPDDIEKGIGLELLGIIPRAQRNRKGPLRGEVAFDLNKPSPEAEAFRALRTALLFRLREFSGCRVLLSTSANPEEGKTTVSINLAIAFHQNNLKVLLIDGDLRRPRIHKAIKMQAAGAGMKEVLEDGVPIEDQIHKDLPNLGFDFISSGQVSARPTEILGSPEMEAVMKKLRAEYDIVIIDSPPYLAVADTVVLADYADCIIVTTRYQKTEKRNLKHLHRRFSHSESKVLGAVINDVSIRDKDHYYQQHYYYGYGDQEKKR